MVRTVWEATFTFEKETWRAGLQGVLDGLNLAGDHAKDLCLNAAAVQLCHSSLSCFAWLSQQYSEWLIKIKEAGANSVRT